MENLNDCKEQISLHLKQIEEEIVPLVDSYTTFFKIEEVFSSENGGKTRLNRQLFNENHEVILNDIVKIADILDESLDTIKIKIKAILLEFKEFSKVDLINLIFDDINFIELLELDLDNQVITRDKKRKIVNEIQELLQLKNRILNYKYFLTMFNTSIFDKLLNKLGVEDLINSSVIFEIIDSYGLQFDELNKFRNEIKNLYPVEEKISSFQFLNSLLELHKRRTENFIYANTRYKISIDYNNELFFRKPILLKKAYFENILSSFIDQSCMDLVKQELKKGKIQKFIDVSIEKVKGKIVLTVKNNGFEIKNINSLFASDVDNKYILESKNLATLINGEIEIYSVENEGMVYTLTFKG